MRNILQEMLYCCCCCCCCRGYKEGRINPSILRHCWRIQRSSSFYSYGLAKKYYGLAKIILRTLFPGTTLYCYGDRLGPTVAQIKSLAASRIIDLAEIYIITCPLPNNRRTTFMDSTCRGSDSKQGQLNALALFYSRHWRSFFILPAQCHFP